MNSKTKFSESFLYDVWKNHTFNGSLKTADGDPIAILDKGLHNTDEAGPDFKNVRLRIGNLTFVGDIEIDRHYYDWKNHGHNIDNKYNSVILHIFLMNNASNGYVYSRNGRRIPSICIGKYVDLSEVDKSQSSEKPSKPNPASKLKCSGLCINIDDSFKYKTLSNLGAERFNKKVKRMFHRLKEIKYFNELGIKEPVISYDLSDDFHDKKFKHSDFQSREIWMQLLYELVFEALGYTQNKLQMSELARAVNIEFLKKIENDGNIVEKFETALLNISGLMQTIQSVTDEDTKQYIERTELFWNSIKPLYDNKYFDETIWHFYRIRPQNFPTIRIAGGARFLNSLINGGLINILSKKIKEIENPKMLISFLRSLFVINIEGFWKNHYILDQKANNEIKFFVGVSRADEIIINVLLPFFALYFEVFKNQKLVRKVQSVYAAFQQRTDNQIISEVSEAINLLDCNNQAIITQGMIELFRSYCSRNRCLECEIGKRVFN